jgi:membrane-associated phospholipid phosphatase
LNIDHKLSVWIKNHLPTETLRRVLGRWNRGEVFFIILIPILYYSEGFAPFWWAFAYLSLVAFLNDRLVLFVKKLVSRGRPLVSVAGKTDSNPDMKHSFPSAHSANSMVVVIILVFAFKVNPMIFIFTVLAGVGRLLSLHHFISDIIGGWIFGFMIGIFGVFVWNLLISNNFFTEILNIQ